MEIALHSTRKSRRGNQVFFRERNNREGKRGAGDLKANGTLSTSHA